MANIFSEHHKNNVFGNVRGVIADALEVPRDQDEIDARFDCAGVAQHVGQQLSEDLILQPVQFIVQGEHVLRGVDVLRHEGIKRLPQHRLGEGAHPRQIDQRFDRPMRDVALGRLCDVDREIADPLEVAVNLHRGHNGSETRGWHYLQGGYYMKQGVDPGKFGPLRNPYAFGELPLKLRAAFVSTDWCGHR